MIYYLFILIFNIDTTISLLYLYYSNPHHLFLKRFLMPPSGQERHLAGQLRVDLLRLDQLCTETAAQGLGEPSEGSEAFGRHAQHLTSLLGVEHCGAHPADEGRL